MSWTLKEAKFSKDKGKVFSCFACGGGSTMGYKLAGFDVIGANEIDPRMAKLYEQNHKPKYPVFVEDIRDFLKREDLPQELYDLDILDGSPPCSSFSMAGNREKDWGKKKKFAEGQAEQVLDTLFFDFIALAERLQPKVVIAENVKGILLGNAIDYVRRIHEDFDKAGYYVQEFLLNAQYMGVPQRRERVFFIALRKDLAKPFLRQTSLFEQKPYIDMTFNEEPIPFGAIADYQGRELTKGTKMRTLWEHRREGDRGMAEANGRVYNRYGLFNQSYVYDDKVCPTLTAKEGRLISFTEPKYLSKTEVCKAQSFPLDYDFMGRNAHYVCGMSVPPIIMQKIAERVYDYWLSKLKMNNE